MTETPQKPASKNQDRLAAALRENLKKRKQQKKARAAGDADADADGTTGAAPKTKEEDKTDGSDHR